jgi:hypothetical protein
LVRWANEPDAPIRRVGDVWTIASQEDAWILIARYLTDDDLSRFEEVALDVLSELNPALELPPEARMLAGIYGKVLSRSNWLREGILEMLALMATRSSEILLSGANRSGEDVARRIVWRLMEQAKDNPILWASLSDKLSLLAEAAPEILLDAIEAGLSEKHPVLVKLFQDKGSRSDLFSSSPHTGLLWALETLALNHDYLSRSALLLAHLTRLDPGGNLGNRPVNSLQAIFTYWMYFHPDAGSSWRSCLQTIDIIHQREPEIAWNLLISLLDYHHLSYIERRTRWRDWVPETPTTTSFQDIFDASDAILAQLVSIVGNDIARTSELIDKARFTSILQKNAIVDALETLKCQQFSAEERVQLCDCLRHEIFNYRKFFDSQWSMSIENIQRLEAILAQFEPDDPIYRHRELFKYAMERDENIEDLRSKALTEILNLQGWDGVLQLAQQVQAPRLVSATLAKAQLLPIDLTLFLRENLWSTDRWRSELATSYIYNQEHRWIDDCLNDSLQIWSAEEYGKLLCYLPFNIDLLDRLDAATSVTQSYFWSHIEHVDFLGVDAHSEQLSQRTDWILAKLLEFGRPHLAVTQIAWVLDKNPELFSLDRIAEVLEGAVHTAPSQGFDINEFGYYSAELMNHLEQTEFSGDRLATLELWYFQIHENYRSPRILFDDLSKNPEFFVEALQCISHAEHQTEANGNDEHPNRSLAQLVRRLLEKWKQLPGILEDGSVDETALRSWVFKVRELAAECDCSKIADCYIGRCFAFSPTDPDGLWPHKAVRDLIEELANPTINNNWRTQISNNRGVTTRLSTDGGEQERIIAEKYAKDAKQLGIQWPQTAAILRKLANEYSGEASREDVNAELVQDFW